MLGVINWRQSRRLLYRTLSITPPPNSVHMLQVTVHVLYFSPSAAVGGKFHPEMLNS